MKRRKINFIILNSTPEGAREKALEWFSALPNLSVDKVTPYKNVGQQVFISFDEENTTS